MDEAGIGPAAAAELEGSGISGADPPKEAFPAIVEVAPNEAFGTTATEVELSVPGTPACFSPEEVMPTYPAVPPNRSSSASHTQRRRSRNSVRCAQPRSCTMPSHTASDGAASASRRVRAKRSSNGCCSLMLFHCFQFFQTPLQHLPGLGQLAARGAFPERHQLRDLRVIVSLYRVQVEHRPIARR